jgi:endonuclease-3 related protein
MDPKQIFDALLRRFGPQHWWPGDTPFEVMVGAILTQQTSWSNVEKAIANLKAADALCPEYIASMELDELELLIRPSGFYRQKALYLRDFCRYLMNACSGDLDMLFSRPLEDLRVEFLSQRGIGPETADSMLLYAGGKPTFVVDAYTIRICRRIGLLDTEKYDAAKAFFEKALPTDAKLYNEYHALLVKLGKEFCRPKNPRCRACPMMESCVHARAETEE